MGKGIRFLFKIIEGTKVMLVSFQIYFDPYPFCFLRFQIQTFIAFRKWKAFYVWRKSISCRKLMETRNYLEENLFISDPILSKALLEIKSMYSIFLDSSFFDNTTMEKMLLFYFVEKQVNLPCSKRRKYVFK